MITPAIAIAGLVLVEFPCSNTKSLMQFGFSCFVCLSMEAVHIFVCFFFIGPGPVTFLG